MNERRVTSNVVRLALATIIAHAAVALLHGAAHKIVNVKLSPLQTAYVAIVIVIAPLVAGLLLWKRAKTAGAILLAGSMAGALVFGVYNHFVAWSPDHVSHVASATPGKWAVVFQLTSILLAIVEAFGVWAGVRVFRSGDV